MRRVHAVILATFIAVVHLSQAQAQTQVTPKYITPPPIPKVLWTYPSGGSWVATDGTLAPVFDTLKSDLDNDGVNDLVVVVSNSFTDTIVAVSAKNGTTLWSVVHNTDTNIPNHINSLNDVNNDGVRDVAVASYNYISGFPAVTVYSGINGALLWMNNSLAPLDHHSIREMLITNDVNANGSEDIIVLVPYVVPNNMEQRTFMIDGLTGQVLWQFNPIVLGGTPYPKGASEVKMINDVNNDGIDDLAFSSYGAASADSLTWVLSGKTGTLVWESPTGSGGRINPVDRTDALGNTTQNILVAVIWHQYGENKIIEFDGKTGAQVSTIFSDCALEYFAGVFQVKDHTNDLIKEIVSSSTVTVDSLNPSICAGVPSAIRMHNGLTGQTLWKYAAQSGIGAAGILEYKKNSFVLAWSPSEQRIWTLTSRGGKEVWSVDASTLFFSALPKLRSVKILDDFTGDGSVEYIVSTMVSGAGPKISAIGQ